MTCITKYSRGNILKNAKRTAKISYMQIVNTANSKNFDFELKCYFQVEDQ